MFLFKFVKHIIETVIEIYEILLIWWVDPQYPWSQGIGSPIWGSSMTRVKIYLRSVIEVNDTFEINFGINSSDAKAMSSKHKDAKIFEKHWNPVMLVFIGKLSLSTLRYAWVSVILKVFSIILCWLN